jgi:hypothetical protein
MPTSNPDVINIHPFRGGWRFDVVIRTWAGQWYEIGWRLMADGRLIAPGYQVGGLAWKQVCVPPKLARASIKNKIKSKVRGRLEALQAFEAEDAIRTEESIPQADIQCDTDSAD